MGTALGSIPGGRPWQHGEELRFKRDRKSWREKRSKNGKRRAARSEDSTPRIHTESCTRTRNLSRPWSLAANHGRSETAGAPEVLLQSFGLNANGHFVSTTRAGRRAGKMQR